MSESYNAIEPGPGNYKSHLPLSDNLGARASAHSGCWFPTGTCLCCRWSTGCLEGFRWFYWVEINEVKLTQSHAHFIEVQAVQTVAVNMSNPECCQLSVSYTSGMPGSLVTERKQFYLVMTFIIKAFSCLHIHIYI